MVESLKEIERKNGTSNISKSYTIHVVKKRNGEKRIISEPSPSIKLIQKGLLYLFTNACEILAEKPKMLSFDQSDYHSSLYKYEYTYGMNSYGFEKSKNIILNAKKHKDSNYFFKTDIQHFFDSIDYRMVFKTVLYAMKLNEDYFKIKLLNNNKFKMKFAKVATTFLCCNGSLATGSPASPALANLYMRNFDFKLQTWLTKRILNNGQNLIYTRYADDIIISSNKWISSTVGSKVESLLKEFGLQMHPEKTHYQTCKSKNVITGINVTAEGKLTVGRKKKEEIKKMLYQTFIKNDDSIELNQLIGNIIYLFSVEEDYCRTIIKKYIPSASKENLLNAKSIVHYLSMIKPITV